MDVRAEAAHRIADKTEVHRFVPLQFFILPGVKQGQYQCPRLLGGERRSRGRRQRAVDPQRDAVAGHDEEV